MGRGWRLAVLAFLAAWLQLSPGGGLATCWNRLQAGSVKVTLEAPTDQTEVAAPEITVQGTVQAEPSVSEVELECGATRRTVPLRDGRFTTRVAVQPGRYTVTARAASGARSHEASATVRVKPVVARVRITSPEEATVSTGWVDVTGTVAETGAESVLVCVSQDKPGQPEAVPLHKGGFGQRVRLRPGLNVVTAVPASGQAPAAGDKVLVHYRPRRPRVRITEPASGLATYARVVTVRGTVDHPEVTHVLLRVNENPQTVAVRDGCFVTEAALEVGRNRLCVVAYNQENEPGAAEIVARLLVRPPLVCITEPVKDLATYDRVVTVRGTVDDPEVTQATLYVNQNEQTVAVREGSFATKAVLEVGRNRLRVVARNRAGAGAAEVDGRLLARASGLRVQLTWDQPATDVDLHVTQADGETCFFDHMETASGGRLDVDDTGTDAGDPRNDGYGPENYTLTAAAGRSIPPGKYTVRVHYYGDHRGTSASAGGPVRCDVKVITDEATPRERRQHYRGVLRSYNQCATPGAWETGDGTWWEVTDVRIR